MCSSCVKQKDIQLPLPLRKHNAVFVCLESMCEVQVAGNKIQSFSEGKILTAVSLVRFSPIYGTLTFGSDYHLV